MCAGGSRAWSAAKGELRPGSDLARHRPWYMRTVYAERVDAMRGTRGAMLCQLCAQREEADVAVAFGREYQDRRWQ